MIKRVLTAFGVLAFAASLALAAEPLKGTVTSIDGKKVEMTVTGEKPAWFKKGASVRWTGGIGRIVEVSGDTITVSSNSASKLKVGDELELKKGPAALQGC